MSKNKVILECENGHSGEQESNFNYDRLNRRRRCLVCGSKRVHVKGVHVKGVSDG